MGLKEVKYFIFIFALILILSLTFVSAGFFSDLWEKINGKAIIEGCEDSDGGMDYYVLGKATGYNPGYNGKTYYPNGTLADNGLDYHIRWDKCVDVLGVLQVHEALCGGDIPSYTNAVCPNGDSCVLGVCVGSGGPPEEPPVSEDCNETDGGTNYLVQGTTYGLTLTNSTPGYYEEVCSSATILGEYSCETNLVTKELYNCSLEGKICSEGKCLQDPEGSGDPEAIICNDVDGLNYFNESSVYGELTFGGGAVTKTDFCNSIDLLIEYICGVDNLTTQKSVSCLEVLNESVCSSGACIIRDNSSLPPSESDCVSAGNLCVDDFLMCSGAIVDFSCSENKFCCFEDNFAINLTNLSNEDSHVYGTNSCVGEECEGNETSELSTTTCGPEEDCDRENALSTEEQSYGWLLFAVILIAVGAVAYFVFTIRERVKLRREFVKNYAKTNPSQQSPKTNPSQTKPQKSAEDNL